MQNNSSETTEGGFPEIIRNITDSLRPMLEKLAETPSELKLSFNDVTLDTDKMTTKINGQITLNNYSKKQATPTMQASKTEDEERVISKTEVTNVE